MCLCVYLGADVSLTEIPWAPAAPSFHVRPLTEDEQVVRQHFSMSHVYYAGSRENCGCAFAQDPHDEELDDQEREAAKAARWDLQQYLVAQGQRTESPSGFEVYSRWVQEQQLPPTSRTTGSVADVHDHPDWFEDGAFVVLQS